MPLQILARPDPRLVVAAVRRGLRSTFLIARGIGWTLILVAVAMQGLGSRISIPLVLLGGLLAVGVPVFLTNAGLREAMQEADMTTYEISEAGVATTNMSTRHAYAWSTFRYVEESAGQLFFGRSRTRVLPVPTAGLKPAQIELVLAAAAGHGIRVRRPA